MLHVISWQDCQCQKNKPMLATKPTEKTCLCLLDYDHCGEVLRFLLAGKWTWAYPLLNLLSQLTEGYDHLILGIGSRRQCPYLEKRCHNHFHGNGYSAEVYSNPKVLDLVLETINTIRASQGQPEIKSITFSPLMLGDLQNPKWEVGESFTRVRKSRFGTHLGSATDSSKRALLWLYLQWAKNHYEFDRAVFIDDQEPILAVLGKFFKNEARLIPDGVKLFCAHYAFVRGHDAHEPAESYTDARYTVAIEGKGLVLPEKEIRRLAYEVFLLRKLGDLELDYILKHLPLIIVCPPGYKISPWDALAYRELKMQGILWQLLALRYKLEADAAHTPASCLALTHLTDSLQLAHSLDAERYAFYQKVIGLVVQNYAQYSRERESADHICEAKEDTSHSSAKQQFQALFACLLGSISLEMVFAFTETAECTGNAVAFVQPSALPHGRDAMMEILRPQILQAKRQLREIFFQLGSVGAIHDLEDTRRRLEVQLQTVEQFCQSYRNLPTPPNVVIRLLGEKMIAVLKTQSQAEARTPIGPRARTFQILLQQVENTLGPAATPTDSPEEISPTPA